MRRLLAGLALLVLGLVAGLWISGGRSERGQAAVVETSPTSTLEPGPARLLRLPRVGEAARAEAARAELESTGGSLGLDLVVEVVDPSGAPRGGIPLALEPDRPLGEGEEVPDSRSSDERGRVVFAGLHRRLSQADVPWTLRSELPFETSPRMRLDAATLAAPSVRFELPPGGSLELFVRELDGSPAPCDSLMRLTLVRPEELHEPDLAGPRWEQRLADGSAHFPWVELQRDWELAAWRPKGSVPSRLRARGPSVLGERVELALVFGSDSPVVSFRVLDPTGAALIRTELELARGTLFRSFEGSTLTTDGNGCFTLDGQASDFEGSRFVVTHRAPGGEAWMGRADLPRKPAPGWNDGGDIRLEIEPLLCAGRVVNEHGPVAQADVQVGEENDWDFGDSRIVRGKSDERGRFELHGLWIEETFRIHAQAVGQRSVDLEVRQGARDVELVLRPRYTLRGELLCDPGVDPGSIRLVRELPDGERVELERKRVQFRFYSLRKQSPSGGFELEPIEGGVFDLVFLLGDVELTRRAELVVRSDLDLGPVDLRGRIARCEIEFVGSGDLSELGGEYSWWPSGSQAHTQGSFRGPIVEIYTAETPIDVELRPRGYRLALLEGLNGRRQHVLAAPLHVRLVLRTDGVIPPPPYRFDCELVLGGTTVSEPLGARWFTPERNAIECLVATAGRLEVRWHLERKVEADGYGGAIGSHVLPEAWATIEVLDVPGTQVFEVSLGRAALEELLGSPPF